MNSGAERGGERERERESVTQHTSWEPKGVVLLGGGMGFVPLLPPPLSLAE